MGFHLYHQPKKSRDGAITDYYSIASSYKDDAGRFQKKIIQRLGRLTSEQAQAYRVLLKNLTDPLAVKNLESLDSIRVETDKDYFSLLICSGLWEHLDFPKIFPKKTSKQKISCEQIARILTINRLLDPCSKTRSISWFRKTMLDVIMGIDGSEYNRSKIFRELGNIHSRKPLIEKAFNDFSQKLRNSRGNALTDVFYLDGTTSWFEGEECELGKFDLEKTRGLYPHVISLMMVTDKYGYPLAWEAVDGNKKDTTQLKPLFKRLTMEFGIKQITFCFDRGVASDSNFAMINDGIDSKFISGIRDNQIPERFDELERFAIKIRPQLIQRRNERRESKFLSGKTTSKSTFEKKTGSSDRYVVGIDNFYSSASGNTHFKDLGVQGRYRYIVAFNVHFFEKEQAARDERIKKLLLAVEELNGELRDAQRDRDYTTLHGQVSALLTKQHCGNFFDFTLNPHVSKRTAQSFQIELQPKPEAVAKSAFTDGLMVYVTDHVETLNDKKEYRISARDIVAHYRNKYIIEDFFRQLKSVVELRPFFVWKEAHVKAHYDIAVMSCFINNYIRETLQSNDFDELSITDFFDALERCSRVARLTTQNGYSQIKAHPIPALLKTALTTIGLARLCEPALHLGHGVYH